MKMTFNRQSRILLKYLPVLLLTSCKAWAPASAPDMLKYELRGDVASMRNTVYRLDSTADGYVASGIEASANNVYVEFDAAGKLTLLQHFGRDNQIVGEEVYIYNGDGQPATKSVMQADGVLKEKSAYKYRRGRLRSVTVTDGADSLVKYEEYEYFGRDSVKIAFSFSGDTVDGYRIVKYDNMGRDTATVAYTAHGNNVISSINVMYDSLGRRLLVKVEDMLFKEFASRMTYGPEGFCSGVEMTGRAGSTDLGYTFKTDSAGNWTERVTYRDGIPVRADVREISYR